MEIFRFRNWEVYTDSKELFKLIVPIVNKMPNEFKFSIGNQILRSALSIPLNIAEGSGKYSDNELNRYFNIANGSISETFSIIDIMREINMITVQEFDELSRRCESLARQLGGFKKVISHKS